MSGPRRICLLGLGEVGQVLAADLRSASGAEIVAWDPLFRAPASGPARAVAAGLARAASGPREAVSGADLVVSAVTAAQCVAAAASAAPALGAAAAYLDLNSVAPVTRTGASEAVESRGGRYVEAAVMSPIGPKRIASPMLLGGPHAEALLPMLHAAGFTGCTVFSPVIGRASAAKMCRSVVIKGMEALLGEALLAARHHGVEHAVIESLRDLFPGLDWGTLSRYMISRSLQHGRRRAEEMREAALTVDEAAVGSWMSRAAIERQDWAAAHAAALGHAALEPMLDAILAARKGGDART
jgi:3-hydroxyisobutyrate dehydrogenase-like beta-hydroxyacid dehydrogenase